MTKQPTWYSLDMLQTYIQLSQEELCSSKTQLQNLMVCKNKPYVLDDQMIDRIITAHTKQNEFIWVYIEQCNKWRHQNPSDAQLITINNIENNANQLKTVNQQILELIDLNFKNHTIDAIIKKNDVELALEFLAGKLNFDR